MRFIKKRRRNSVPRHLKVGDETMRKRTSLALAFALGTGFAGSALAQSEPAASQAGQAPAALSPAASGSQEYLKYKGIRSQAELIEKRARLEKKRVELRERRERRMQEQIGKLRERASKLRNEASRKTNELDKDSLEREAQRLEQKATAMQDRAQRVADNQRLAAASGDRPGLGNKLDPSLSRDQRGKIRKAQMRRRWGQLLGRSDVTEELKVHAERAAKLRRIRALAKEASQDELVQRSNRLLAKEQQRHLKRMQGFEKEESGASAPGDPSEPAAPNAAAPDPAAPNPPAPNPPAPNEPAAVQAPASPAAPANEGSK
jgi:hypothetical protein